ncbi:MAG: hypothetical protein L0H63_05090 [Nitrococcus sp.]|nr:hypothetical protein [Nitrococcus sp.]
MRLKPVRTIQILVATVLVALCQNAYAITVLVDAAWVRAGVGSAGDRCLDDVLLDLKPGDSLKLIIPVLDQSVTRVSRIGFTLHRRPGVRAAELIAARRLFNKAMTTVDPTGWSGVAQTLSHLAAAPNPDQRGERRYVIIAALTAADPPVVDLALQRLLRGRSIVIADLAGLDSELRQSRLKAWRDWFAAAGVAQLAIRSLPYLSNSEPQVGRGRMQTIDCSGYRLQVLDH